MRIKIYSWVITYRTIRIGTFISVILLILISLWRLWMHLWRWTRWSHLRTFLFLAVELICNDPNENHCYRSYSSNNDPHYVLREWLFTLCLPCVTAPWTHVFLRPQIYVFPGKSYLPIVHIMYNIVRSQKWVSQKPELGRRIRVFHESQQARFLNRVICHIVWVIQVENELSSHSQGNVEVTCVILSQTGAVSGTSRNILGAGQV